MLTPPSAVGPHDRLLEDVSQRHAHEWAAVVPGQLGTLDGRGADGTPQPREHAVDGAAEVEQVAAAVQQVDQWHAVGRGGTAVAEQAQARVGGRYGGHFVLLFVLTLTSGCTGGGGGRGQA